ncbi:MAG: hypothetical protein IT425_02695 [Pirellulales bacterium]|nr:hypothetical protein [Pirellulales bacterium]
MARIILSLSSVSIVLLFAALWMGLTMGDLYVRPMPTNETMQWAMFHRLTGIAAGLMVVFVESVAITYFVGTSRWCKEVAETYHFDMQLVAACNRLKRRLFFWAVCGMLTVVVIIALGGAADPATLRPNTQAWADWHLLGAIVGIIFVAWTYFVAWKTILANNTITEKMTELVKAIRREKGLDSEPPPPAGSQPPNSHPLAV